MSRSKVKLQKLKDAFSSLHEICMEESDKNRFIIDATIQRFEFTFELAWKFLRDYFLENDIVINFPKEVIQKAYEIKLIDNEDVWIAMLKDRNMTSHTYNQKLADEIYIRIKTYRPEIQSLVDRISKL